MFRADQRIGVYVLVKRLGRGGFGEVWLAEKRSQFVSKKVAVKLPLDEQIDLNAIRREATLWEEASGHANVLPIIDADIYDGQVVIVSEYAEGGSLADRLNARGTPGIRKSIEMVIGILSGLEFLHHKKIIHRDIKPSNILLQGDTPRLADFGISRAMQATALSSNVIGTDSYMAPEAFRGARTIETDIWSVGVVLYQLLNGRLPFPQANPSERMYAILQDPPGPIAQNIPAKLGQIIETALSKSPEKRYRSAAAMREVLQEFLQYSNPEVREETVTVISPSVLPKTVAATPHVDKTLVAVPLSPPIVKSYTNQKSPKQWRITVAALGGALIIFAILIISAIPGSKTGNQSQGNFSQFSNLSTVSPSSPQANEAAASQTRYDIPSIQGQVRGIRFFETGGGDEYVPIRQRVYSTTFLRHLTRYINFELDVAFETAGHDRYFTLDWEVYFNGVLERNFQQPFQVSARNRVDVSTGYGGTYGTLKAGSYKYAVNCNGRLIATGEFVIEAVLAGDWDAGSWGTVKVENDFSGTYTVPKGSFTLKRLTDGTYSGRWGNSEDERKGTIQKIVLSADGDTATITWNYTYPANMTSYRTSTWTRKK